MPYDKDVSELAKLPMMKTSSNITIPIGSYRIALPNSQHNSFKDSSDPVYPYKY